MERYLYGASPYHPAQKQAFLQLLGHRVKMVSDEEHFMEEKSYLTGQTQQTQHSAFSKIETYDRRRHNLLVYVKGTSDKIICMSKKYGIKTIFKPHKISVQFLKPIKGKTLLHVGVYNISV